MSLIELFFRNYNSATMCAESLTSTETMTCPLLLTKSTAQSPMLRLPPELRTQICEYIIGHRVVHIRMNWVGIFSPAGFLYSCFNSLQPLLESSARDLIPKAVPFDSDITVLSRVCWQMYHETSSLPFQLFTWAFDDVFTLDQFVTAKGPFPLHQKEVIRRVAVASPGPHRSHEGVLRNLQEVLLMSTKYLFEEHDQSEESSPSPQREILRLRRDTLTDTWLLSE
jgi:hypothetical protein